METKSCSRIESDRMVEILKHQLYFAVIKGMSGKKIKITDDALYFSIDDEFEYQNYYYDFGPYNISYLYKYCVMLNKYLQYSHGLKRVVHCTSTNAEKKVNAAFLIGSFCIIYLKLHPSDVTRLLMKAGPYKQFMDASQIPCTYTIKLEIYFNAIFKAIASNFFNFDDFDATEYDMYEKLQFGNMNWLVPRKFLAFIGPNSCQCLNGHPPSYYIKYFLKNDIKTVIRLNNKMYDATVFSNAGIDHYDLIYPDGSTPSNEILMKFLHIAETAPAAVAVHCKAGLGRTGSLIGAYIVKHYKMSAKEAIAWMRICRPGSVIGQQQLWLEKLQLWLWKCGSQYRYKHYGEEEKIPRHKFGIYSKTWPVERIRILRETRRKYPSQYSDAQCNIKLDAYNLRNKPPYFRFKMKNMKENNCFENISELLTTVYGFDNGKNNQHKLRKPNIRTLDGSEESRRRMVKSIYGNRMQGLTKHDRNNHSSIFFLHKKPQTNEITSQGDSYKFTEDKLNNNLISSHAFLQIPAKRRTVLKVDNDTDTGNHVQSYMEEKAKRKAFLIKSRVTQGDKLLEKKLFKSENSTRIKNDSGCIVDVNIVKDHNDITENMMNNFV